MADDDRTNWTNLRVLSGDNVEGTVTGPPNRAGNVLVVWDDHQRTWSQARLLRPIEPREDSMGRKVA